MLISSMWLLEAANQSDLETGIEHNICPNPLRVNRGRKSHEKEMDASFFCSKPPMPTRRSSIPIRTTTAQHKNVKICFYITTEKEKPERGGAPPADGAGEASGGEVRRRADVALLLAPGDRGAAAAAVDDDAHARLRLHPLRIAGGGGLGFAGVNAPRGLRRRGPRRGGERNSKL